MVCSMLMQTSVYSGSIENTQNNLDLGEKRYSISLDAKPLEKAF